MNDRDDMIDDDRTEGSTDDDADGKIDDIALHGEFAEFLQHVEAPSRGYDETLPA